MENSSFDIEKKHRRTRTVEDIVKLTDAQLAGIAIASKYATMPDSLDDVPDEMQRFVYEIGLNSKPTVVNQQQFEQFMQLHNIPKERIMTRAVYDSEYTAEEINNMFRYSEYNYIGGKRRGRAFGAGTYFERNGGYTPHGHCFKYRKYRLMKAVYNPATARVISYNTLRRQFRKYAKHNCPTLAKVLGFEPNRPHPTHLSIYALALGYNAISAANAIGFIGCPYCDQAILDRSAVVVLDEDIPWYDAQDYPAEQNPPSFHGNPYYQPGYILGSGCFHSSDHRP